LLKKEDLKDEPTKIITARHSEITIFHIGKEPYAAASLLKKCTHKKNRKTHFLFTPSCEKKRTKNPSGTFTLFIHYYIQNSPYSLHKSKILYSLTNLLLKCVNDVRTTTTILYVNMLPTNIVLKVLFFSVHV